jgi:hypothetical protein
MDLREQRKNNISVDLGTYILIGKPGALCARFKISIRQERDEMFYALKRLLGSLKENQIQKLLYLDNAVVFENGTFISANASGNEKFYEKRDVIAYLLY